MFVMEKYVEEAWTPELGGVFEDFQLKIRFISPSESKKILADKAIQVDGPDGPELKVDLVKAMVGASDLILNRVTGWKNTPTKYSEQNKAKLLSLLLEDETGITLEGQEKPAKLGEYITWFAKTRDNFLADSAST